VQDWDITSRYFGHQQRRSDDMHNQRIGIENRAAFTSCLERELTRWHRGDERLALLVAEVGLSAGDDGNRGADAVEGVRVAMARRLRLAVGDGDTVMRVGPGSFAIMCRGLGGWPALSLVLERLQAVDREPVDLFGDEIWGSVSVSAIFADKVGHGQESGRAWLRHLGLGEGTTGP
jgi:GGDEF domain-containing protein